MFVFKIDVIFCVSPNNLFVFSKIEVKEPALRPKGLGLGANKMSNAGKQAAKTEEEKELVLKKGAYAKITHGHHKSSYCQVYCYLFFFLLFYLHALVVFFR